MREINDNSSFDLNTNDQRRDQIIRLKIKSIQSKNKVKLIKIIAWCFLAENLKIKLRKGIQNQMKKLDKFLALFYFIGFSTNLIQDLLYFKFDKTMTSKTITIIVKGVPTLTIQVFRSFTTFTTIICLLLLPYHYKIERYLSIMKNEMPMNKTFVSKCYLPKIILIVILTAIHCPPYFDGFFITIPTTDNVPKYIQVDLLMFINVFVSLRWLLAINYFAMYSVFADDRADKICEESKVNRDLFFSLKSQFKYQPMITLLLLFIASVFLFGYILRNTEVPFIQDIPKEKFQDWTNILNAFWSIVLSFFTIGYGDYYPQTVIGRIVMIISSLWGIFIVGLIIIYVSSNFLLNDAERRIFDESMMEKGIKKRKRIALEIIYTFYHFNNFSNENSGIRNKFNQAYFEEKKLKDLSHMHYLFHIQKILRKEELHDQTQFTTIHLLDKFNSKVEIEIDGLINRTRTEIESTKSKLKTSKNMQTQIKKYTKTVSKMTKCLYDCIDNKIDIIEQSIIKTQDPINKSNEQSIIITQSPLNKRDYNKTNDNGDGTYVIDNEKSNTNSNTIKENNNGI